MANGVKKTTAITLAGGGNETFAALARLIRARQSYSIQLAAGTLTTTPVTVNLEVSIDGTNYVTLVDSAGDDVTFTVATDGTPYELLVDLPYGVWIRPKFVTDSTGPITVTTIA